MAAGKDVYVEKPLSITIHEGRRTVEAARRIGREPLTQPIAGFDHRGRMGIHGLPCDLDAPC